MAFGVADGGSPLPLETGAVTGGGVVGTTMYEGESKPLDTELFLPDLADLAVEIPFPFPLATTPFPFPFPETMEINKHQTDEDYSCTSVPLTHWRVGER